MTPDDASALEREELEEHVSEILFDAQSSYDPECLFCQRATALGLFARYGFDPSDDAGLHTEATED